MPAEGIHLTALREVAGAAALDAPARRRIVAHEGHARLGAILVDLPYFHRFAGEVVRYALRLPPRPSPWGAALHTGGAVSLLRALTRTARRLRDDELGAAALGLASHLAIDRAMHPLVNSLARRYPAGKNHDASHREVEKFQSICFHEEHLGRDFMGTAELTRYLDIPVLARLSKPSGAAPFAGAWRDALGAAPNDRELAGFARGYSQHIRLIGSPIGKRIAPPPAKDAARPRYLHGAWGTFAASLRAAIEQSAQVLNAVAGVLDAGDAELADAERALDRGFPAGTIDPQGDDETLLARS